jgi:hypothetical protein
LKDSIISFLSVGGWLLDLYPYRDLWPVKSPLKVLAPCKHTAIDHTV